MGATCFSTALLLALCTCAAHAYYIPSFMDAIQSAATTAMFFKPLCQCGDKAYTVCKGLMDERLLHEDETGALETCITDCLKGRSGKSQKLVAAVESCNAKAAVLDGLNEYRGCSVGKTLDGQHCGGNPGFWDMLQSGYDMNQAITRIKTELLPYAKDLEACSESCMTDADRNTMAACKNLFDSCKPNFVAIWDDMQYCTNKHQAALDNYCACVTDQGVNCPY